MPRISYGKKIKLIIFKFIMPPTLKKLKGHIALGLSVGPSVANFR